MTPAEDAGPPLARSLGALAGNALLCGLVISLFTWLCHERPVLYAYQLSEDQGVEYATFVAAALGAVLVVAAMVRQRRWRRPGYALLAAAAFALAMEEISWGQRILEISTPAFLAERNTQREITLHNLFDSGRYYYEVAIAMLVVVVGLWLAAWRVPAVARLCQRLGVPLVDPHLWPFFALIAYSQVRRVWVQPLVNAHELTELFATLALAAWGLDLAQRSRDPLRLAGAWVNAVLFLLIAGLSVPFVLLFRNREDLQGEFAQFAGIQYPSERLYRQAVKLFEHGQRHPELSSADGRWRHGLLLRHLGDEPAARQILGGLLAERMEALSSAGDDPGAHLDVAEALLALDRAPDAAPFIDQARAIVQRALAGASDGDARASAHVWLGVAKLMEGDTAAAHASFAVARETATTDQERERLGQRMDAYLTRHAVLGSEPRHWR